MSNTRRPHNLAPAKLLGRAVALNISRDPIPVVLLAYAAHLLQHLDAAPPGAEATVRAARPQAEQLLREAAWEVTRAVPASLVTESAARLAGRGDVKAFTQALENIRAMAEGLDPLADLPGRTAGVLAVPWPVGQPP